MKVLYEDYQRKRKQTRDRVRKNIRSFCRQRDQQVKFSVTIHKVFNRSVLSRLAQILILTVLKLSPNLCDNVIKQFL